MHSTRLGVPASPPPNGHIPDVHAASPQSVPGPPAMPPGFPTEGAEQRSGCPHPPAGIAGHSLPPHWTLPTAPSPVPSVCRLRWPRTPLGECASANAPLRCAQRTKCQRGRDWLHSSRDPVVATSPPGIAPCPSVPAAVPGDRARHCRSGFGRGGWPQCAPDPAAGPPRE